MAKTTNRSTVNKEQYAAPEFSKSGFSMPYSRHTSFMIGRMHISGVHYTMPSDKIYGTNKGKLTFNRITTPMVTPCDVGQYNFYLPLRAIDKTFEQGMTPTELNAMSANWHTPKCNTRDLAEKVINLLLEGIYTGGGSYTPSQWFFALISDGSRNFQNDTLQDFIDNGAISFDLYTGNNAIVTFALNNLRQSSSSLFKMADKMYLSDALQDIADNIVNKLGSSTSPIDPNSMNVPDFLYTLIDAFLSPWIGRYSYFAELRFNYLRPFDIYRISRGVGLDSSLDALTWFDNTPLCEYPLRVMYVIWYERFRDVHLEPVSATLPYWRDFGSTSIFDLSAGGNLCYLLYRIRSWYNDPFTTAQVDDISRHVYAPIVNSAGSAVAYRDLTQNNLDTQSDSSVGDPSTSETQRKPAIYSLGWRDQLSGSDKRIDCPVPSNVNDILATADRTFYEVYGLDLNTLRQSQQLERYLKRNYLFGDEYQDRMLAHYNSRVSDMRINRPELLGQSLNQSDMKQEVSNVSTEETKVGDRTATSTVEFGGDDYSTFCEEFGIVINLLTIMPRAIYDGLDQHLLLDQQVDFPLPEFAANNEEFGRKSEIASSGLAADLLGNDENRNFMFGRYPAYHIWRGRVDEVGGMFLDELQDCTYRRFWGQYSIDTTPKLNYWFLHCRPNLGMFVNTNRYDCQLYGTVEHEFMCERVLPTPVEVI